MILYYRKSYTTTAVPHTTVLAILGIIDGAALRDAHALRRTPRRPAGPEHIIRELEREHFFVRTTATTVSRSVTSASGASWVAWAEKIALHQQQFLRMQTSSRMGQIGRSDPWAPSCTSRPGGELDFSTHQPHGRLAARTKRVRG
jgi:hypothetical protein